MSSLSKYVVYGFIGIIAILIVTSGLGYLWLRAELAEVFRPQEQPSNAVSISSYSDEQPKQPSSPPPYTTPRPINLATVRDLNPDARPWVRWWWPGADVEADVACEQLTTFARQGFGAVELQPFAQGTDAISDTETIKRIRSFDTPEYYDVLGDVMACAQDLGIGVSLNHLSGWPAGGPQVLLEDGMKSLAWSEVIVKGGKSVSLRLPEPKPSFNNYVLAIGEGVLGLLDTTFAEGYAHLLSVVAIQVTGGNRSMNPFDLTDTLNLNGETTIVLDEFIVDGTLKWEAPDGKWAIISTFVMPSGEAPTLNAAPRPGYVLDHLSKEHVEGHYNYAFGERTGLNRFYGEAFQGIFNDSLEFKINRMATDDILSEFQKRRRYDLRPYLPAITLDAADNWFMPNPRGIAPQYNLSLDDKRIRHDYRQTISDLMVERFVISSFNWAQSRSLYSRGQAYGSEIDVLRALGASHIPEVEQLYAGGSSVFLKMAHSAASLYGRPVVSSESFVWENADYTLTPQKIKAAADKLFLSGVNQIIYHGASYTTSSEPYQAVFDKGAWYPWSAPDLPFHFSGNFNEGKSIARNLSDLNNYISRTQNLLQSGKPNIDVFIYYPWLGTPDVGLLDDNEFLYDGVMEETANDGVSGSYAPPLISSVLRFRDHLPDNADDIARRKIAELIETLDAKGVTWAWINDHALQNRQASAGSEAQADINSIIVAHTPTMEVETAEALRDYIKEGTEVLFVGDLPSKQRGFYEYEEREERLTTILAEISKGRKFSGNTEVAETLDGSLIIENAGSVRRVSRAGDDGEEIHFFANQSLEGATVTIKKNEFNNTTIPYWFDPAAGMVWRVETRAQEDMTVTFAPLESRFLLLSQKELIGDGATLYSMREAVSSVSLTKNSWQLKIGDITRDLSTIAFDTRNDEALRYAAGPFNYTTDLEWFSSIEQGNAIIDLGLVDGAADVLVNGQSAKLVSVAPAVFDLTGLVKAGDNTLAVTVYPPERNAFVGRALSGDPKVGQMSKYENALVPVGLRGPVTVYFDR
ncbi:MAG: glycosyl hydrolase [Pseudomonadota bacterium]